MVRVPGGSGGGRCGGGGSQSQDGQGPAVPDRRPGCVGAGDRRGGTSGTAGGAVRGRWVADDIGGFAVGGVSDVAQYQGCEEAEEGSQADSDEGGAGGVGDRQEDGV